MHINSMNIQLGSLGLDLKPAPDQGAIIPVGASVFFFEHFLLCCYLKPVHIRHKKSRKNGVKGIPQMQTPG